MHWLSRHPVFLGLAALLWLLVRTGRKPSRLGYPCQQAALRGATLALAVALVPGGLRAAHWAWRRRAPLSVTSCLLALLALGGISDTSTGLPVARYLAKTPADYTADVYVVDDAGGPSGDHHLGVDQLVAVMGTAGLKLYRSPLTGPDAGPQGIVGANDVVLIKVNQQWAERGGTNTDVLKGLIARILEHPDGFTGEVVVVENGQGLGTLDWGASNAEDRSQSALDVVNRFAGLGRPVSGYLWDAIRATSVAEYSGGDARDGYVVGPWESDAQISVSYPKFRTAGGRYVSLKYGIWDPALQAYDASRLKFLNVPVLKCHSAYGVTASVKHHVGTMTTALSTNTHAAVASGGIGRFLAEVRMPDLNVLDCIYILAKPGSGPNSAYTEATRTNKLVAGRDPVALDLWAVTNVLVPAIRANGYTSYPDQDPADSASTFRHYLDRTAARLLAVGIPVTNDPARIAVHRYDTSAVEVGSFPPAGPHPNPFVATTAFRFVARRTGTARLDVYDVGGRLRRSVLESVQQGSTHEIRWDGADQDGRALEAGTYWYRLGGAGAIASGKVTILR